AAVRKACRRRGPCPGIVDRPGVRSVAGPGAVVIDRPGIACDVAGPLGSGVVVDGPGIGGDIGVDDPVVVEGASVVQIVAHRSVVGDGAASVIGQVAGGHGTVVDEIGVVGDARRGDAAARPT